MTACFQDRADGGMRLAASLADLELRSPVVLGIPRGGIPVGLAVAESLQAPFEVFVARKLGAPSQPEFGVGAIAEGGGYMLDRDSCRMVGLNDEATAELVARETERLGEYVDRYRSGGPLPDLGRATAVLVDDGIATGVTVQAAVAAARRLGATRVLVAAPVASPQAFSALQGVADAVIVPAIPPEFRAVGQFYADFEQLPDAVLTRMLADHRR